MGKVMQGDLFDVEEIVEINRNIVADREKKGREEFYDRTALPYFENPKDDNELMFTLQYRYLKNKDLAARDELYKMGYKLLHRLLWAEMRKSAGLYLDEEQQSELVATAFVYVFRRYEKGRGYTVDKNFIVVLRGGIRHALQYRTMASDEVSLDSFKKDPTHRVCKVF